MPPSWARLGSARIQLELEAFQLGSARLVQFLVQLVLRKFGHFELFVDFEFYGRFFLCDIHMNVIQILAHSR